MVDMDETNGLLRELITVIKSQAERSPAPPVASATGATEDATREEKVRLRVVDAAMTPRDYVNQYLDEHPDSEQRLHSSDFGYRELAAEIGAHFGMDFDHTTVYRAVKKRRSK